MTPSSDGGAGVQADRGAGGSAATGSTERVNISRLEMRTVSPILEVSFLFVFLKLLPFGPAYWLSVELIHCGSPRKVEDIVAVCNSIQSIRTACLILGRNFSGGLSLARF